MLMKQFPGIVKVVVPAALVVSAILFFQACMHDMHITDGPERKYGVVIPWPQPVQEYTKFCSNITNHHFDQEVLYCFEVKDDQGKIVDTCSKPSDFCVSARSIKTDKIVKFQNTTALTGGLVPIGSHVTQRIYSNEKADVDFVLTQFKE